MLGASYEFVTVADKKVMKCLIYKTIIVAVIYIVLLMIVVSVNLRFTHFYFLLLVYRKAYIIHSPLLNINGKRMYEITDSLEWIWPLAKSALSTFICSKIVWKDGWGVNLFVNKYWISLFNLTTFQLCCLMFIGNHTGHCMTIFILFCG